MFEFVVVVIIIGAAWYYFRQKKQAEGSESDTTAQTSAVKPDVTSAPEPVKAKPVVEPAKASKPVSVIPEDSALRRHYMQNLAAGKQNLETPFPEDSALRRHYLQNTATQQDDSKETVTEEVLKPVSAKTEIPVEAEVKRDVIQQLVAETEATMPPRPTDSTLKRHYDTHLMSVVLDKLQASK